MKKLSPVFKLLLFGVISYALYLEIFRDGVVIIPAFFYFTIQSNLLVAFCLLLFALVPMKDRSKSVLRGVALLAITLTGLIYNFVLYRIFADWGTASYTFTRTVTHVVAPLGFLLDWLLFDRHNMMKWRDIFLWLVYPAVYGLASLYASHRYGLSIYSFLNMTNGYGDTLKWLGGLVCVLLVICFLYVGADKAMGRKKKMAKGE